MKNLVVLILSGMVIVVIFVILVASITALWKYPTLAFIILFLCLYILWKDSATRTRY